MTCFRIIGIGARAPGPIEKIAHTAAAAEVERSNLQRLCGRHGKAEVSVEGGRTISLGMLRRRRDPEIRRWWAAPFVTTALPAPQRRAFSPR